MNYCIHRHDLLKLVERVLANDRKRENPLLEPEERHAIKEAARTGEHFITGELITEDEQCCIVGCAIPKARDWPHAKYTLMGGELDNALLAYFDDAAPHVEYRVVD